MKKVTILFLLVFGLINIAESQDEGSKWYTGGGFVLNIGTNSTMIGVNPILGYNATDRFSVGAGATYNYYKYFDFKTSIYGGNIFSKYLITNEIFAQTEFHLMNVETYDNNAIVDEQVLGREWVPIWFVGGGYRQALGSNVYANATLLFDIIEHENSPYTNPYFSFGVSIHL